MKQSALPDETLKRTNVRLSQALHAQLKSRAANQNETIEDIVRRAVERELQGAAQNGLNDRKEHEALVELQHELELLSQKLRRVLVRRPSTEELVDFTIQSFFQCLPVPLAITDQNGRVEWSNTAYEAISTKGDVATIGSTIVFPTPVGEVIERSSLTRTQLRVGGQIEDWWLHRFTVEDGSGALSVAYLAFPVMECQAAKRSEVAMVVPQFVKEKIGDRSAVPLLKACLQHLPTVAVLKDLEGRYLWFNPQFEQLVPIGTQSADSIGKLPEEIFPLRSNSLRKREERVKKEGVAVLATEVVGEDVERTAIRFPVFNEEGTIAYLGVVSIDPRRFNLSPLALPLDIALEQQ